MLFEMKTPEALHILNKYSAFIIVNFYLNHAKFWQAILFVNIRLRHK